VRSGTHRDRPGPRDPADYWPDDDNPYLGGFPAGGGYSLKGLGPEYNGTNEDPAEAYRRAECEPECEA
jgi:hypothetical protein